MFRALHSTVARRYIVVAALAIAIYLLAGCGASGDAVRTAPPNAESARVAKAVANAQAGLSAVLATLTTSMDPRAEQMILGAQEYNLAAAGKTALPVPDMSPAQILAAPDSYHAAGTTNRQHADGTWLKVLIGGVLTAMVPIAAMLLKDFGGPVGSLAANVAMPLANAAWHAFAPKVAKDADDRAVAVTVQAKGLIYAADSLVPGQMASLPQPIQAAIAEIRQAHSSTAV